MGAVSALIGRVPVLVQVQVGALLLAGVAALTFSTGTDAQRYERVAFALPAAQTPSVPWEEERAEFADRMTRAFDIRPAVAEEFAEWILEAASRQELEPELLASLVLAESSFRKRARSRVRGDRPGADPQRVLAVLLRGRPARTGRQHLLRRPDPGVLPGCVRRTAVCAAQVQPRPHRRAPGELGTGRRALRQEDRAGPRPAGSRRDVGAALVAARLASCTIPATGRTGATLVVARLASVDEFDPGRDKPVPYVVASSGNRKRQSASFLTPDSRIACWAALITAPVCVLSRNHRYPVQAAGVWSTISIAAIS